MGLRHTVSISVKVCRVCHQLLPSAALTCRGCGKYELVAVRCRVDRSELDEFYRMFRVGVQNSN